MEPIGLGIIKFLSKLQELRNSTVKGYEDSLLCFVDLVSLHSLISESIEPEEHAKILEFLLDKAKARFPEEELMDWDKVLVWGARRTHVLPELRAKQEQHGEARSSCCGSSFSLA